MKGNGYFEVTSIHRDDLTEYFTKEEIEKLTDDDMDDIAENMGTAYVNGAFWDDLKYFASEVLSEKKSPVK